MADSPPGSTRGFIMGTYFFIFAAAMSAYVNYVSLWLREEVRASLVLVGLLSAASALSAFLAQPLVSLWADRSPSKNKILLALVAAQGIACVLHVPATSWPWALAVMSLYTMAQGAALALSTSVILDALKSGGQSERFGGIRLWHSWGFALSAALGGWAAGFNVRFVFYLGAGFSALALLLALALPRVPGYQHRSGRSGLRDLLKYREFIWLSCFSLIIHSTYSLSLAFLPLYFTDLGAPPRVYGLGVFIMAAAETPFLLCSGWAIRRMGLRSVLVAAGVLFTVRWLLTAAASTWWQLLALYALQGGGIIMIYVGLARYVSDQLPKELSATGQAVVNSAVVSLSRVIGALVGGLAAAGIGLKVTFVWMGGFCLAATVGVVLFILRHAHIRS